MAVLSDICRKLVKYAFGGKEAQATELLNAVDGVLAANTATVKTETDGTTTLRTVDSRNTIANVNAHTFQAPATTIVSAAAVHENATVKIADRTITYTGTNTVTSSLGCMLNVGVATFTDASAGTVTTVSAVHVNAVAAAGGSITLTNRRMISTSVSDCFLTNAGVWTDTACFAAIKDYIERGMAGAEAMIDRVIAQIQPATWQYAKEHEVVITREVRNDLGEVTGIEESREMSPLNDFGRNRVGIIYDDLPPELRAPGEEKGVSAGVLASFGLAAIKLLSDRNKLLEARVLALETR